MTQAVNDSRSPGFRTPGRLSSIQAFFRVFRKSCFEPLRGRRAVMLVLLALLPILLMGIARLVGEERGRGLIFFIQVIVPFYHYINMIFFIFIGCSALGESLEDRTLTYDLICPVSRNMIFSGKYAAYAASTATVLLGVLLLAYIVCMAPFGVSALFQYIPALSAVSLTTFFAVLIYGAVFISLSLLIKRAVFVAIILAVAVDGFLAYLPLRLATLSPQLHLRNLAASISGDDRFRTMIEEVEPIRIHPGISLCVLVGIWACFMLLGGIRFSKKQLL